MQKEQYDLDGKYVTCDISTDGYKFYKINPKPENTFIKYDYNIFSNPEFEKTFGVVTTSSEINTIWKQSTKN